MVLRQLSVGLLALVAFGWNGQARAEIAVPKHTDAVVDQAGILSPTLRNQLSVSLRQFHKQAGPQLQLLTVPDLEGEPIESFSIRVAESWKLGDRQKDDGLLMVVAVKDRAIRIEVGQGLEGQIPDALAGRIINNEMIPLFRAGRPADGIVLGFQRIVQSLGGELQGAPASPQRVTGRRRSTNVLPFLFIFFMLFPQIFGRRRGRGGVGGLVSGMLLGGMMGRGSRSHAGGFGGGGFGGFGGGGGGFSGGGASGRW